MEIPRIRRPEINRNGYPLSEERFHKQFQIRLMLKIKKFPDKWRNRISFLVHFIGYFSAFIFFLLHLCHISCFYSIRTYVDSLKVSEVKGHFIDINNSTQPIIVAEKDPLKIWWNTQVKDTYQQYFNDSDIINDPFLDYLDLHSGKKEFTAFIQEYDYDQKFYSTIAQRIIQAFMFPQSYFCILSNAKAEEETKNPCWQRGKKIQTYLIEQNYQDISPYPNYLSFYITQFGILTVDDVFFVNFFYEILGQVKNEIKIQNILDCQKMEYLDINRFPSPPDSMVKYIYQLKLTILLKTIFLMMILGGLFNFLCQLSRKMLFIYQQKSHKLFKTQTMLLLCGTASFLYYLCRDLKLGFYNDSYYLKVEYILSYFFIMNVSYICMPIKTYRSMMMTEFYIYNTIFLTYTFTYPYSYKRFLQVIYDVAVFSIFVRYILKKNAKPFEDVYFQLLNDENNLNDLIQINQEQIEAELNQMNRNYLQQNRVIFGQERSQNFGNFGGFFGRRQQQNQPPQNNIQLNTNMNINANLNINQRAHAQEVGGMLNDVDFSDEDQFLSDNSNELSNSSINQAIQNANAHHEGEIVQDAY